MTGKQIGILIAVVVVAAVVAAGITYAVLAPRTQHPQQAGVTSPGSTAPGGTAPGGAGGSSKEASGAGTAADGGTGAGSAGGARGGPQSGTGSARGRGTTRSTIPNAQGGQSAAGIPSINAPRRNTIAYLKESFATGTPRFVVHLRIIGWQGSPSAGALVVQFLDARPAGGGTVKGSLDTGGSDYVVTVQRPIRSRADLENRPVNIEFRLTGGLYQAYLVP